MAFSASLPLQPYLQPDNPLSVNAEKIPASKTLHCKHFIEIKGNINKDAEWVWFAATIGVRAAQNDLDFLPFTKPA